jgi:hypothetical protein
VSCLSFKAVILLKNRELVTVKANATKTHFKYGNGLYIINEQDIQNVFYNGKIPGAEAIYFEGNPTAIGYKSSSDGSSNFLDEIVRLNALKQTASSPRNPFRGLIGFLAPLKDPVNLIYLLFGVVIVYGLIAGALGWV